MTSATSCNLTVRIDKNLKDDATELFRSLGMSLSTAISVFLLQALRNEGMPFRPRQIRYNEATERAFIEVEQMKKDPNLKGYSVQEALQELKK